MSGEYGGNYGPPSGFDWDVFSSDEMIQDDPALEDLEQLHREGAWPCMRRLSLVR